MIFTTSETFLSQPEGSAQSQAKDIDIIQTDDPAGGPGHHPGFIYARGDYDSLLDITYFSSTY